MINIKTPREIELMRVAGEIVGDTNKYLIPYLKEGISTKKIDSLARDYIIKRGAIPSCYKYNGYPGNICISINEEVVHGIRRGASRGSPRRTPGRPRNFLRSF